MRLYIAANTEAESRPWAHKLGDTVCAIHSSWQWVHAYNPKEVFLSLCRDEKWNPLWSRFIRETRAEVIWDDPAVEKVRCYEMLDARRHSRTVHGSRFDLYRELYARLDGGRRQRALAGGEWGLHRRNVFEYFWWGQEQPCGDQPPGLNTYAPGEIDIPNVPVERRVLVCPVAVCQGNRTFTREFWRDVAMRLVASGIPVTWNDATGPGFASHLLDVAQSTANAICGYVARHALCVAGNTGIGWISAATGTPLIGMEPHDSFLQDYRYERCGVASLRRIVPEPYVAGVVKLVEHELDRRSKPMPSLPREPFLEPFLQRVRDHRAALDIGAGTGEWTSVLSPRFDWVYAVEPNPTNPAAIERLGLPNVTLLRCAAWVNDCELLFHRYENSHMGAVAERDMQRGHGVVEKIPVPGRVMDRMNLPPLDLIKVDVEGAECEALKGCTRMVEAWHPLLVVECHEPENRAWLETWLTRSGYHCEVVSEPGRSGYPVWLVATWRH